MDADVIIVGAGPTGLMLAGELRLAGVRPLVLERQPQMREIPKANGFNGQILELLRYRGLLDRFERPAAARSARPLGPRSAGCIWIFCTWRNPRYGGCASRNRSSSACSTNTPANSAPTFAVDTRWSGSARTTPR